VVGGCKGPKDHLTDVQIALIDQSTKTIGEFKVSDSIRLNKERSCHMSVYSEKQNKLYVLGGFDGWECLKEVEVVDLSVDTPKFEAIPDMESRVKNGVAILNESDQCIYIIGGWDEK